MALLGLAFGLWASIQAASLVASDASAGAALAAGEVAPDLHIALGALVVAPLVFLPWLPTGSSRGASDPGRTTFWALVGAMGVGLACFFVGAQLHLLTDFGLFGFARFGGLVAFAYAVFRNDLARADLPHFAIHRGPIAIVFTAILFMVAQVAQNFFAAQYGLALGGVVAGAFLFAARPLQDTVDGLSKAGLARGGGTALGGRVPGLDLTEGEMRYRNAARLAARDRPLTREEEAHLYHLAQAMGIGAGRAHEILSAIEAERLGATPAPHVP
jgi:hypothetical protein